MLRPCAPIVLVLLACALPAQKSSFTAYPAAVRNTGRLAMPVLRRSEERRFRHVLKLAITKGYGVVNGGTEHERPGPNFAGIFVLVQWGCGLDCMEAALIDTRDGSVLKLPVTPGFEPGSSFQLPTGSGDLRTLQFRTDSRLLGIPSRRDGFTYYFTWEERHWRLQSKQKTPVSPEYVAD